MTQNICKTFCINLGRRSDRREIIEKEMTEYGLNWEIYEAIDTPTFGSLGCCISHLTVLQIAKERNYDNVLILEDDFTFVVPKEELNKQLSHIFQETNEKNTFDVCMLAYNLIRYHPCDNNSIANKIIEAQTASGYIVQKHYYDTLINLFKSAIPLLFVTREHWKYTIDQIWKPLQLKDNWIYFTKRIGKQKPGYSDNCERYCEYEC
jgi:GR25 family glycosyltransferase involved in LPS biosynthesis